MEYWVQDWVVWQPLVVQGFQVVWQPLVVVQQPLVMQQLVLQVVAHNHKPGQVLAEQEVVLVCWLLFFFAIPRLQPLVLLLCVELFRLLDPTMQSDLCLDFCLACLIFLCCQP